VGDKMEELSNIEQESKEVQIPIGPIYLNGDLDIPTGARGIVVFARGTGSKSLSSRDQYIAQEFNKNNLGTLLLDLLTVDEVGIEMLKRDFHFDIEMLSIRLIDVSRWLLNRSDTKGLNLGYFGTNTGTAAALIAAKELKDVVKAVASKGGRPDLAEDDLMYVESPTLFIVGGKDAEVVDHNKWALDRIVIADKELKIIPGSNSLFEEQGAIEEVAHLACNWFKKYLL
jgi:pimeloyl-ACP methyl ester carboxylesterase